MLSYMTILETSKKMILIHLHTHNRKYTTIVKTNMSIILNNEKVQKRMLIIFGGTIKQR